MKKIVVIKTKKTREASFDWLQKEMKNEVSFTIALWKDIWMEIGDGIKGVYWLNNAITEFDFVWLRNNHQRNVEAKSLAKILAALKIKYVDDVWEGEVTGNKLSDLITLSLANLPVISSLYIDKVQILNKQDKIKHFCGFPLVAKEVNSNRGTGVYLIRDFVDLQMLVKKAKSTDKFIFQKYVENTGDYRILVLGNKVGAWEKRIAPAGDFRNNAAVGGREYFYPLAKLPVVMRRMSIQAARLLRLQIAGVDIVQDNQSGKYYILEVNRSPGFTHPDKGSPELPAVARYFREVLKIS